MKNNNQNLACFLSVCHVKKKGREIYQLVEGKIMKFFSQVWEEKKKKSQNSA